MRQHESKSKSPTGVRPIGQGHAKTEFDEVGHERLEWCRLSELRPARINDAVYRPVDPADPKVVALAKLIAANGVDPLVVTADNVIVSGHRRRVACQLAGVEQVPVRRRLTWHSTDPEFSRRLVEFNEQRVKSADEVIREEVIRTCPDGAIERLIEHRHERLDRLVAQAAAGKLAAIRPDAARRRAMISPGKRAMLDAARQVLADHRAYWPLSLRQVHYRLLNAPPPRNTIGRYRSGRYQNDRASYQDLSDLLTRARLAGLVPWEALSDETRPVSVWRTWPDVGVYLRGQLEHLFDDYRRDLLQSQAAHIEIVAEKLTVQSIADRVAVQFGANVLVGRGFSSITSRYELVRRFRESGKASLVLLVVADFDPEGECIAETLTSSIRDEFAVDSIQAHKVALTAAQVRELSLPAGGKAKLGSSRYDTFVRRHGELTYELEALEPAQLEVLIRDALRAVLDQDLLKAEERQERQEARELEARRRIVLEAMGGVE